MVVDAASKAASKARAAEYAKALAAKKAAGTSQSAKPAVKARPAAPAAASSIGTAKTPAKTKASFTGVAMSALERARQEQRLEVAGREGARAAKLATTETRNSEDTQEEDEKKQSSKKGKKRVRPEDDEKEEDTQLKKKSSSSKRKATVGVGATAAQAKRPPPPPQQQQQQQQQLAVQPKSTLMYESDEEQSVVDISSDGEDDDVSMDGSRNGEGSSSGSRNGEGSSTEDESDATADTSAADGGVQRAPAARSGGPDRRIVSVRPYVNGTKARSHGYCAVQAGNSQIDLMAGSKADPTQADPDLRAKAAQREGNPFSGKRAQPSSMAADDSDLLLDEAEPAASGGGCGRVFRMCVVLLTLVVAAGAAVFGLAPSYEPAREIKHSVKDWGSSVWSFLDQAWDEVKEVADSTTTFGVAMLQQGPREGQEEQQQEKEEEVAVPTVKTQAEPVIEQPKQQQEEQGEGEVGEVRSAKEELEPVGEAATASGSTTEEVEVAGDGSIPPEQQEEQRQRQQREEQHQQRQQKIMEEKLQQQRQVPAFKCPNGGVCEGNVLTSCVEGLELSADSKACVLPYVPLAESVERLLRPLLTPPSSLLESFRRGVQRRVQALTTAALVALSLLLLLLLLLALLDWIRRRQWLARKEECVCVNEAYLRLLAHSARVEEQRLHSPTIKPPPMQVAHLQEEVLHLSHVKPKQRARLLSRVWPVVEAKFRADSRIRTSVSTVRGQANVRCLEWIAASTEASSIRAVTPPPPPRLLLLRIAPALINNAQQIAPTLASPGPAATAVSPTAVSPAATPASPSLAPPDRPSFPSSPTDD